MFRELVAGRRLDPCARGAGGRPAVARAESTTWSTRRWPLGAKGLVWVRQAPDGAIQSSILKAAGEESLTQVVEAVGAGRDDLTLIAGGRGYEASALLGQFRLRLAQREGLIDESRTSLSWVVDFPLMEWSETEQRLVSMHHPFTSPRPEDLDRLEEGPGRGPRARL